MYATIYHVLFGLLNAAVAAGLYILGKRKGQKESTDPENHKDCLKALALLRMNYEKKDGAYSQWIHDSLTYAIERIAEVDKVNTYIGTERIPPKKENAQ